MKKKTTITTHRKEVWVIREMPKPKSDQEQSTPAFPHQEPNEESEEVKPSDEGKQEGISKTVAARRQNNDSTASETVTTVKRPVTSRTQ